MEHHFSDDDDFGEIYADLQVLVTPPPSPPPPQQHQHDDDNHDGDGGGDSNNNNDDDTDSEDGLNIVLNDDDCHGGGCGEDGDGLVNNQEECIDQSKVGSQQFVSSDAYGGQSSKIGVKGGHGSQFFRSKVCLLLSFFFYYTVLLFNGVMLCLLFCLI